MKRTSIGDFVDRILLNLDFCLALLIFLALSVAGAAAYYIGVESGLIIAGAFAPYAYIIGPFIFMLSMLFVILWALARSVRRPLQ